MTDTRAGLTKVAVVRIDETPHTATLVAIGDEWLPLVGAEISTRACKPAEIGGEPQTVTRIRLAGSRRILFTLAEAEEEGGLLDAAETAQTDQATSQLQPLVDQLAAINTPEN